MPGPGKIDLLWRPACSGGRALLPALGRIIYFSNSGREEARSAQPPPVRRLGRSAEAPAPAPRLRGVCREVAGLLVWDLPAGSSDVGGVTQVAAGRGEAEAQRYGAETAVGCWRSHWGGSLSTFGPTVS